MLAPRADARANEFAVRFVSVAFSVSVRSNTVDSQTGRAADR
jgi:hypothetical protein